MISRQLYFHAESHSPQHGIRTYCTKSANILRMRSRRGRLIYCLRLLSACIVILSEAGTSSPSPRIRFSQGSSRHSTSRDCSRKGLLPLSNVRGTRLETRCVILLTFRVDFVGNEQETHRLTIDSIVQERPLRELYLKPFEIAVREANPWAIMSSYNLVNGVHADMNKHTLKDILRGEWGYDG